MTFTTEHQPIHDRAAAARKANSPWRKSTTLFAAERRKTEKKKARKTS